MCQAKQPNQVEVLLGLYMARLNTLDPQRPMKHYLSTRTEPRWIHPNDFTTTTLVVQRRLREALDKRFFNHYCVPTAMQRCAYVFERQARLHPTYKCPESSLNRITRLCTRERGASIAVAQDNVQTVNEKITTKLQALMLKAARSTEETVAIEDVESTEFSNELAEAFAPRAAQQPAADRNRDRVDGELRRWMDDPMALQRVGEQKESVLSFWRRMEESGEYRMLPRVARTVFAVPCSSAQVERDFGVSGMMVTTQRASLSSHVVDMVSFVNRNRAFVDAEQCTEIQRSEIHHHIPTHTVTPLNVTLFGDDTDDQDDDVDGIIVDLFSQPTDDA